MTEIEQLCAKVKTIAQGPNADLLKKFIDLLYQEHEPEYFSPEDLAAIAEGKAQIAGGEYVTLEELKKELGL